MNPIGSYFVLTYYSYFLKNFSNLRFVDTIVSGCNRLTLFILMVLTSISHSIKSKGLSSGVLLLGSRSLNKPTTKVLYDPSLNPSVFGLLSLISGEVTCVVLPLIDFELGGPHESL